MLKKRIIPVQLLLDGRLVKTVGFDSWRDVGDPVKSSKVYNDQQADELVFLNISRTGRGIRPLLELLERVSEVSFMPLAMGGGIASLDDARALIKGGADKVVVNSACYQDPGLITAIAREFGEQAVIVGIDVRREPESDAAPRGTEPDSFGSAQGAEPRWSLWSGCGRQEQRVALDDHVQRVAAAGAGEIFIQSIDRDGTKTGYDVPLLARVATQVRIPVIGCGGSGTYEHLREAFQGAPVEALACGSLFNFGDNNPIRAKAHLSNYGIPFKVV